MRRVLAVCLLGALSLVSGGCIKRRLTIRSEPPGATILLNDQDMGTTPYSDEFSWYGTYRVILKKDGYVTLYDKPTLTSPWYLWVPLDLVVELWPRTLKDHRELSYTLAPQAEIPAPTPPAYEDATPPATEETDGAARLTPL